MTTPGPPAPDGPGAPRAPHAPPARDASPAPDAPRAPDVPRAERVRRPVAWMAAAVLAVPLSFGGFWLARHSGAARPLCGDRPGTHYPSCQLPPPWGTGAPPTTSAFVP